MIRIYTEKKLCPHPLITLNDKYFNTHVNSAYLDEYCRKMMLDIDDAEILDEAEWRIKTRFGIGDIRNLSTGVKTLINTYNLKKQRNTGTIDVREVGENLIPQLLVLINTSEICLFTGNYNFVGLVDETYQFIVNDVHEVTGTVNLSLKLEELRWAK